jgi:acetyl esterase/lipase
MKKIILLFTLLPFAHRANSQEILNLYPDSIPNSKPTLNEETSVLEPGSHILIISKVSRPELSVFLPPKKKANGTAILICPGGGYSIVAAGHEGSDVAKKLNEAGIAAFVLKYRIPDDSTMVDKEIGPLQDAQRAIQLIRERAAKWKIDTGRVGVMGFSAGGHLASTLGTHYIKALIDNPTGVDLRPSFMILVYPVISFTDSIGHIGSRNNLIGMNPSPQKIEYFSNELQVNSQTPPSFLVHAKNDDVVRVQNSIQFYEALKKSRVAAEIYLYEQGGHGFGLHNPTSEVSWLSLSIHWLQKNGWLGKSKGNPGHSASIQSK